jgi:hypothetical protein
MSLAFALMAAINGSTGSSATLSHGLKGTKPHRRQCRRQQGFSSLKGDGASRPGAQRGTLAADHCQVRS